jgi:hypothetical protein
MFEKRIEWARQCWLWNHHRERYRCHLASIPRKYVCQDCRGRGGEIDVVLPETGQGPWEECGWCEGTGYVTPWMRGHWLHWKRGEKRG